MSEMRSPAVLREPAEMMRLRRLGSLHQSRLSFMRILMRRMARDKWEFTRPIFEIDAFGVGHAVYTAKGPERSYSLVAFAHDLPDEMRSDRVIAEAWDTTFCLFDGVPTTDDIARLSQNVPLQEGGRISGRELSLSRANRSVRLWDYVVDRLAAGKQPDAAKIKSVGYLMRTTAVYGSGKFGAADREAVAERPEMRAPFQAEMLSVYLIRTFVRDLVQAMARAKGGDGTVDLSPEIAASLGIGNSTGLGMAPFIVNHPVLFNNWILAREEAIRRVRSVKTVTEEKKAVFLSVLERAGWYVASWQSEHPIQTARLSALREDVVHLQQAIAEEDGNLAGDYPWDRLMAWAGATLSEEGQEFLASLILEPYPELVDELADDMADDAHSAFCIDGAMTVGAVRALLQASFGWALQIDWDAPENIARAWYVSAEKLEPRLGERFEEPIADYEQPLDPARAAASAHAALWHVSQDTPISEFLRLHPEHRHTVRRAQISRSAPYGEIRDNTIAADVLPTDMLRAKLSFFGATNFDPRSDRWVRVCMFAGAPYPEQLNAGNADLWAYPERPA